ncbi:hypothetical protein [Winogradskya humida]|uniref:DUF7919 domain-containing protein n=1 Tax=Winogradskya humida TaxID=113566 RepID=A0ABQ4A286_9ACTN|nr:hypothetical protein [Actinoplanes humidus]GIE24728.1 hypothetical protein Ahu01nite_078300 [Actinoplanes humidus]
MEYLDLSPYEYMPHPLPLVNIGWLGSERGLQSVTGSAPLTDEDIERVRAASPRVGSMHLGFHDCEFCTDYAPFDGNGEYRYYAGNGVVYAAPVMILHYMEVHRYRPPQVFLDQLPTGDVLAWDGRAERLVEVARDPAGDLEDRVLAVVDLANWKDPRALEVIMVAAHDEEIADCAGDKVGKSLAAYLDSGLAIDDLHPMVRYGIEDSRVVWPSVLRERQVRRWLKETWDRARKVVIADGGEDGQPVAGREVLATVEDETALRQLREWTTSGNLRGDVCRCPGDLTVAVYDAEDVLLGSGTLHPGRVSWERERFRNDLLVDDIGLRLFLSGLGVGGSSSALLSDLLTKLDLVDDGAECRQAGDVAALEASRVPPVLFDHLRDHSGLEAAGFGADTIGVMVGDLVRSAGQRGAVRQVLAWLGSVVWPTEALGGDGQVAKRMLESLGGVERELAGLTEPAEVMGAVVWAIFRGGDDTDVMNAVGPAVGRVLRSGTGR